jgi:hypothetical protein
MSAVDPDTYLTEIMPSQDDVGRFLTRAGEDGLQPNRGWTYDNELGWVHADAEHAGDGVNGARTFYRYEDDGARRLLNGAGQTARIHAFGDSFTHCDQVNDGETWAEAMAAHLGEPVRNYGVGGYSVYQASRRLRRVQTAGSVPPAELVILNIWDDDHYRNLDSWRRLRHGRKSVCGYTLPHIRVDLESGVCSEHENLCPTADSVYSLCDPDWVCATFRDDPVLKLVLAGRAAAAGAVDLEPVAVSFGLPVDRVADDAAGAALRELHTRAALAATQYVLERTEAFLSERGIKLLVVLSFGVGNVAAALRDEPPFDQALLDFLSTRSYPVVDMRSAFHAAHREAGTGSVDPFLAPYYNGHHSPRGNVFTAWALMDAVRGLLQPPAPAYR